MPTDERPKPKPVSEWRDVYGLLEQVRLRPAMFVPHGSLDELMMLLTGYCIALDVHGIDEHADLAPVGPFAEWLRDKHGWSMSRGWARAITEHAQDLSAWDTFFRLLDEWRKRETSGLPRHTRSAANQAPESAKSQQNP